MNIKETKPHCYYLECFFFNDALSCDIAKNKEMDATIAAFFENYKIIECGGQNGFGFAYVKLELPNADEINLLIDKCYELACCVNTTVESLSITRWVKTL